VKYVERGTFPHTRRYFSVLRCNHCEAAPCVTICPTVALYRRPDGIVDFDGTRCIGCKSCLQGCPYDALYIDPATGTAAKCHYCAHRIEVGLEPACVIVCPEQAIVAGDLDEPGSRIARLVATEQVQVRKAEQGTRPKVFYVGGDAAALTPTLQAPAGHYMFAQPGAEDRALVAMVAALHEDGRRHDDGVQSRSVYDVPHLRRPWGWKVSTYLWTKSIAAGALLLAALGVLRGDAGGGWLSGTMAPLLALVFLALTTGLLVFDLKRPERFHYVLLKANWRSWLVWGAVILMGLGAVAALWLLGGVTGNLGLLTALSLPAALLAAAAAGYSAFLFGQAEGRDFWQSPLLLPQLLVSAAMAGTAALLLAELGWRREREPLEDLAGYLMVTLVVQGVLLIAEVSAFHGGVEAARAARLLVRGPFRARFWGGVVLAGTLLPLLLVWLGGGVGLGVGAVLALAGLWLYEDLWIRAGQALPLS
jgi:Fe-S-cluster-containing dehydrogenase component/formate-dependent nitrite reductase membrane component NrfD